MVRLYLIPIIFICFNLLDGVKITVDYDKNKDVIIRNGIVYLPLKNKDISVKNDFDEINDFAKNIKNENSHAETEGHENISEGYFWFCIFMITFLTCFAGLMSGLTVGYLSIDDLVLELKTSTGTDEEKDAAGKVLPVLANRHWLLVTLLLMNAFAMEYLPLFLDKVVPEYLAIIISVSLVLLFGEVIPQAICTGPDQVKIAAKVAPLTRFLMLASSPISYPIAKLLDYLLGEHHKSRFINNDLKALIELHTFNSLSQMNLIHDDHQNDQEIRSSNHKMGLYDEQANLMISALEIREKKVIELMIPIKNTFMIDYDEILDKFKLQLILDKGYSRIPVFSNHNSNDIVGLLRIKNLIGVDFNQNKTLRQLGLELKKPLVIPPRLNLIDLLREFKSGRSHMAFITEQVEELQEKYGLNQVTIGNRKDPIHKKYSCENIKILGIITLEDVIEKMINLEILDEDDYEKMTKQKRSQSGNRLINKAITKEIARTFIKEESLKLDTIIKESFSKKKSIQEMFLKKSGNDSVTGSLVNNKFLKDHLV